jgi:hypothetical protein
LGVQVVNPFKKHIEGNPSEFMNYWSNLLERNKNILDSNVVDSIRDRYRVSKKDHYEYLKNLIHNKLPFILKELEFKNLLKWKTDGNDFSTFIDNFLSLSLCNSNQIVKDEFDKNIELNKKSLSNGSNSCLSNFLVSFFDLNVVVMGLNTSLSVIAKFIKLIPNLYKDSERMTKDFLIKILNDNKSKQTLSKLMKALDIQEFSFLNSFLDDKTPTSPKSSSDHNCSQSNKSHPNKSLSYDPQYFILQNGGIEFQPNIVFKKCPFKGSDSQETNNDTVYALNEINDNSRIGCPAKRTDLDLVINHFEKVINLVPDKKFKEWMTSN